MVDKKRKVALFDALLEHLEKDLNVYGTISSQQDHLVSYQNNRIGREAFTSVGRFYAIKSLLPGLRKRFIGETTRSGTMVPSERKLVTIQKFIERNEWCRQFNSRFKPTNLSAFTQEIFLEWMGVLSECSMSESAGLSISRLASLSRNGPGSSSGIASKYFTGEYTKVSDAPVTYTNRYAYTLYRMMCKFTKTSWLTEQQRFANFGKLDVLAYASYQEVPKTNAIGRSICTHATANMPAQLSIHEVLADVLRSEFACDLRDQQDHNRVLAMYGSKETTHCLTRTWRFCTDDLSMASDYPLSIPRHLLLAWPRLRELVFSLRSSHLDFTQEEDYLALKKVTGNNERLVKKHIMSSMGNGFTFSLMTLLFSSLVRVLYMRAGIPEFDTFPDGVRRKTWAVFGDDIIVDKLVRPALHRVLAELGFIVNHEKSYGRGYFRESCGSDWYYGYNVRPVFCETLETTQDLYSLYNRLTNWGVIHSVELPSALSLLYREIKKREKGSVLLVPNTEDVSHGIHSPLSLARPKQSDVTGYQGGFKYEVYRPRSKRIALFKEVVHKYKYTRVTMRPVPDPSHDLDLGILYTPIVFKWIKGCEHVYHETIKVIPKVVNRKIQESDYRTWNANGIALCMMHGSVKEGIFTVRPIKVRYDKTWVHTPGWGDPSLSGSCITRKTGTTWFSHLLWEQYVMRMAASN